MKNTQIFARQLRRSLTPTERRLWYLLRNRHFACYKFRRQHPVGPYILDFACCAIRLAIELDGGQHDDAAPAGNRARDGVFYASGILSLKSMKMR
ncbi:endonuclease domain-containing protein [Klebsiella pneumoniae]|uniref:endonuclease domain-containing protein n=1 Tax=Klebsiella pneumoniae TaxID=573 RepID=UPI0035C024A7